MTSESALLDVVVANVKACEVSGATLDEQLFILELAWHAQAQRARSEALSIPGQFQEVKTQQLELLEKMAALVRDEQPDLGLERLYLEGDFAGAAELLRRQMRKGWPHGTES